jgi:hypothetical protein
MLFSFFISAQHFDTVIGVRKQHGGVRSGGRSRANSGEGELPHLHQPGQVPRGPLLLRPGQGQSHLQVSFRTKILLRKSDPGSAIRHFLYVYVEYIT